MKLTKQTLRKMIKEELLNEDYEEKMISNFRQQMDLILSYARRVDTDKAEKWARKYFRSAGKASKDVLPAMIQMLKKMK